jgi:hypothetical protein
MSNDNLTPESDNKPERLAAPTLIQAVFPEKPTVVFFTAILIALLFIFMTSVFGSNLALNGLQANLVLCLGVAENPGQNLIHMAEGAVEIENRLYLRRGQGLADSMRLLLPQPLANLLQQRGDNLMEIPGDADIRHLKQGGLGVGVDGHHQF